ncbi:MAG: 4-hydroxythreonine-4-phosphate dehydrogenase PdxA [Gammaproteobacteria bacterium]|jgi:4-hydroxythreonine-4-phosphate dehydrogenase|nr:4-hydroxythreonine-4-phosphate dehydrogenase PdxA [Gammaproteobacteria bacterium]
MVDEYTASVPLRTPLRTPLALTLGDPAGIGAEVAARVIAARAADPAAGARPLLLIGAGWALEAGAAAAGVELPALETVDRPEAVAAPLALLDVAGDCAGLDGDDFAFGRVDARCGEIAVRAVETAARGCLDGTLSGMVTCPIHKEAIHAAGYVHDIGHQEILGRLTGAEWTATMLMTPGLRVVHLSTHKSLIEAARYVTRINVLEKLRLTARTLGRWGMPRARIAVAALNPHGGEGGLLGREELDELQPAVADARAEGLNVSGPWPADSVFNRAIDGEFDVVLALYHDQGHIAIKVHDFHASTTATLGIPFVRTSVDHGTAFDIAGRGVADPRSLGAAIEAAEALIDGRLAQL